MSRKLDIDVSTLDRSNALPCQRHFKLDIVWGPVGHGLTHSFIVKYSFWLIFLIQIYEYAEKEGKGSGTERIISSVSCLLYSVYCILSPNSMREPKWTGGLLLNLTC